MFKTNLTLFIISILTPYVSTIFFLRTLDLFIFFHILFFSLVTLIVTTISVIKTDQKKSRKKYYWMTAIFAVFFYIFSIGFQVSAANWIFFKSREKKLTIFITELKKYDKIKEMSDGQRYWKSVNFTSIEANISKVDTINELRKKFFLDDILKRDGIDKEQYEFFRNLLVETKLISFTTLEDGTISFTIGGFLDNCVGFAYSETGKPPRYNDCGEIISWRKIGKNWYVWSTT